MVGHDAAIHTTTISPDGIFCASGGKDNIAKIWDIKEGKVLYEMTTTSSINCLSFSPVRYWLVAATDSGILVWDLETKNVVTLI